MKLTFGSPECGGGAQRENVWNQNHPTNTLSCPFKAEVSKTEFQASSGMSLWCLTIRTHTPPTLFMLHDLKNVSGNHPWLFSYRTSVFHFMHQRDHKPGYKLKSCQWIFSFVQFSCSVGSDSLRPHELQHSRLPCPSPAPNAYLNSCPSSWWCHPTISSSVIPFSSRLQSFPASRSFPVSQLFASGGQSTGASFSISISPSSEHSGLISFRIGWFDLFAVQSALKNLLQHHHLKVSVLWCPAFFMANSPICTWLLGKP